MWRPKLKSMQSPQEAMSHPVKSREFIFLTQSHNQTTAEKAVPQGRVLLCYRPTSSGLLRDMTKRSQFQVPACASTVFISHAPAPAGCRACDLQHQTGKLWCWCSYKPKSFSFQSLNNQTLSKRDRSLSLAGDPFYITHLEFASVVQPLKEQSPTDPC